MVLACFSLISSLLSLQEADLKKLPNVITSCPLTVAMVGVAVAIQDDATATKAAVHIQPTESDASGHFKKGFLQK